MKIKCLCCLIFVLPWELGEKSDRSVRHFSSLLQASRTPEFQYLYRTHRFLRALQVPAHFSSWSIVTNKVTPPYPEGGGIWAEEGGVGAEGEDWGQALKSFDAKSTQKDTLSLLMRMKSRGCSPPLMREGIEFTQPLPFLPTCFTLLNIARNEMS